MDRPSREERIENYRRLAAIVMLGSGDRSKADMYLAWADELEEEPERKESDND